MRRMRTTVSLLLVSLAVLMAGAALVTAEPMDTCGKQTDCISFTFELLEGVSDCQGADCEWEVCLHLDLDSPFCVKDSNDTVSHVCEKTEPCGDLEGFGTSTEVNDITSGYVDCQVGAAGTAVQFLIKDGTDCNDGSVDVGGASCEPRPEETESCTGNLPESECVWTVQVPNCPDPE
jgi:hypothetical protein